MRYGRHSKRPRRSAGLGEVVPTDLGEFVDLISAKAKKPRDKILKEIRDTHKRLAIIKLESAACFVAAHHSVESFEDCMRRWRE